MEKICELVKNNNNQATVSICKTTFKRIKRMCKLNDNERFDQNGDLDEEFLENLLEERPGVDNSPDHQGTELNLLDVSRQRCLIIGDNNLEEYKQQEEAMKSRSGTEKERTRSFSCLHCNLKIRPADNNWRKCKHKKCGSKYCTNPLCISILASHEELCRHQSKRTRRIQE